MSRGRGTGGGQMRQAKLAKSKVFTTFEMSDLYNTKLVYAGYVNIDPTTEPVRQDWPSVLFYIDSPRLEMQGFYDATTLAIANQGNAGPSDRQSWPLSSQSTTHWQNQSTIATALPAFDDVDFKYYLKPYFTHHRIYNPNNHAMWIKIEVIAPRMPLTAASDPSTVITNYMNTQYNTMAIVQENSTSQAMSALNVSWKNLDTVVNASSGASCFGLFPRDRTWKATYKWKTVSTRKKVLVPAGGVFKFRVFHRGFGPLHAVEFQQPSFIPYPYTDRIIKLSSMSTLGMSQFTQDATNDRIHTDFVAVGVWTHSMKTMKCYVINRPVVIQSMTQAQIASDVIAPSVNPQIIVAQQEMGPDPL